MTSVLLSVLLASLLGSTHCAGMCGAFVILATSDPNDRKTPHSLLQGAYHLGRLTTYTMLGSIAGVVGRAIDLGGENAGIARSAAIVSSAILAAIGVAMLLKAVGVQIGGVRVPRFWQKRVERGYHVVFGLPPTLRAGGIGLLTTLLPCGWLYTAVITAAGTGDPIGGSLVMLAFWGGTLPMLSLAGMSGRKVGAWLGSKAPFATALLMILLGLGTAIARVSTPVPPKNDPASHVTPFCGPTPPSLARNESEGSE